MKKTKRLATLFLALMMALSCMVMPAMAAGGDDTGVMPLYEQGRCPVCGQGAEYQEKGTGDNREIRIVCRNSACLFNSGWFKP